MQESCAGVWCGAAGPKRSGTDITCPVEWMIYFFYLNITYHEEKRSVIMLSVYKKKKCTQEKVWTNKLQAPNHLKYQRWQQNKSLSELSISRPNTIDLLVIEDSTSQHRNPVKPECPIWVSWWSKILTLHCCSLVQVHPRTHVIFKSFFLSSRMCFYWKTIQ